MTQPLSSTKAGGRVMTDTVNVPREPTEVMLNAAVDATGAGSGMSWKNLSPQSLFELGYRAMIAAAPKAEQEQEPVAWRVKFKGSRVWKLWDENPMEDEIIGGGDNAMFNVQNLYTHPAPASDELLEALKPFADAAEDLDDGETGPIWERPAAMSIDASDLRRAYELYAKQGAQS